MVSFMKPGSVRFQVSLIGGGYFVLVGFYFAKKLRPAGFVGMFKEAKPGLKASSHCSISGRIEMVQT